jgi:acetylglutamate kinase
MHSDITIVKLGGRSIETESGRLLLGRQLAALRQRSALVVVHGGGAQVTAALAASGIEAKFVGGLRVTDEKTLEIAEPVFAQIGKQLAHALTLAGAPAVSLTGRDAGILRGHVKDAALGRVGTIDQVDAQVLRHLAWNGLTPVVGPIAIDTHGPLNVNADEVAGAAARALGAKDLLLLTDVPGVKGPDGLLIPHLTAASAKQLVADGVAIGGMVPKIHGALDALASGVARVRVLDEPGLARLAEGGNAGTVFTEA